MHDTSAIQTSQGYASHLPLRRCAREARESAEQETETHSSREPHLEATRLLARAAPFRILRAYHHPLFQDCGSSLWCLFHPYIYAFILR
jgi:hypothetical protein